MFYSNVSTGRERRKKKKKAEENKTFGSHSLSASYKRGAQSWQNTPNKIKTCCGFLFFFAKSAVEAPAIKLQSGTFAAARGLFTLKVSMSDRGHLTPRWREEERERSTQHVEKRKQSHNNCR